MPEFNNQVDINTVLTQIMEYARNGINWDKVLDILIESNPQAVLTAIELSDSGWKTKVMDYAQTENKVPTIRLCRELTGMGLLDAKEWVESNCWRFVSNPVDD